MLDQLRDQRIVAANGDAPCLGTGYGTFPEVFRNTHPAGDSPTPAATSR